MPEPPTMALVFRLLGGLDYEVLCTAAELALIGPTEEKLRD